MLTLTRFFYFWSDCLLTTLRFLLSQIFKADCDRAYEHRSIWYFFRKTKASKVFALQTFRLSYDNLLSGYCVFPWNTSTDLWWFPVLMEANWYTLSTLTLFFTNYLLISNKWSTTLFWLIWQFKQWWIIQWVLIGFLF